MDRTDKIVKQNPLKSMLGIGKKEEHIEKVEVADKKEKGSNDARKRNPKAYERYRGKSGDSKTKPMGYYLTDDQICVLGVVSAMRQCDKSEIIRELIEKEFAKELKDLRDKRGQGC